jgi:hypothetical protein
MGRRKWPVKPFAQLAEQGPAGRRLRRLQEQAGLGVRREDEDTRNAKVFLRVFDLDKFLYLERVVHEASADNETPFDIEGATARWQRERARALKRIGHPPDDDDAPASRPRRTGGVMESAHP